VTADGLVVEVEAHLGDGRCLRLLGRRGPEAEVDMVRAAAGRGGSPVLLGAGAGHASDWWLKNREDRLAVVDPGFPLTRAGGAMDRYQDHERVFWVLEPDPEAAAGLLLDTVCDPRAVVHPLYQRLHSGYFTTLRRRLEPGGGSMRGKARPAPRPRAAWSGAPRVLLLTSQYFITGEAARGLELAGAEHRLLDLGAREMDAGAFLAVLEAEVDAFRPDLVFTVNHLGFDRQGVLAQRLMELGLPAASWFVDNPELILPAHQRPAWPGCAALTWDADNLDWLAAQGFAGAAHLPLAVNIDRFRPGLPPGSQDWSAPVSFVGNSMRAKVAGRLAAALGPGSETPLPEPAAAARLSEAWAYLGQGFMRSGARSVRLWLEQEAPEVHGMLSRLAGERRLAFETLVTWEATRRYRLECLAGCLEAAGTADAGPMLIAGDAGWKETLPGDGSWRWHPELSYYDDLPGFYPQSLVNFNATSLQMKGAMNQRVFDVPACGAFLLTDHREQMDQVLEPGREVAVYRDPGEVPGLVRWWMDHPEQRLAVARAGHERVRACHDYGSRMRQMLEAVRPMVG
jgi:spore maturation protein CgeB